MNSEPILLFKKFAEEHFQEYQSWFKDKELKTALGGVDEEWLNHILHNEEGIDYAVFENEKMIGVVGVLFPTEKNPYYVLTNIAVHHDLKNMGKGAKILECLFQQKDFKSNYWLCYVAIENISAQRFFKKNHWIKNELVENEMYCFKLKV